MEVFFGLPSTARSMMVGRVFLVLTGACHLSQFQFGHGVGGFTTNFIHSEVFFGTSILAQKWSAKTRVHQNQLPWFPGVMVMGGGVPCSQHATSPAKFWK